jgi:hypothetical protein
MKHIKNGQKLERLNNGQDVQCKYVSMLQQGSTCWTKYEWKGGGGLIIQQQWGQKKKKKKINLEEEQHQEARREIWSSWKMQ